MDDPRGFDGMNVSRCSIGSFTTRRGLQWTAAARGYVALQGPIGAAPTAGTSDLIGHWPMARDTDDYSPLKHVTKAIDVELGHAGPHGQPGTAARFNGSSSLL